VGFDAISQLSFPYLVLWNALDLTFFIYFSFDFILFFFFFLFFF